VLQNIYIRLQHIVYCRKTKYDRMVKKMISKDVLENLTFEVRMTVDKTPKTMNAREYAIALINEKKWLNDEWNKQNSIKLTFRDVDFEDVVFDVQAKLRDAEDKYYVKNGIEIRERVSNVKANREMRSKVAQDMVENARREILGE